MYSAELKETLWQVIKKIFNVQGRKRNVSFAAIFLLVINKKRQKALPL